MSEKKTRTMLILLAVVIAGAAGGLAILAGNGWAAAVLIAGGAMAEVIQLFESVVSGARGPDASSVHGMGDKRGVRRVISEREVVRGASRHFLRHATLDMEILAIELSISRATLYRVVHSRDRLLGAVLWRLGERVLADARKARTQSGVDGVLQVTRMFCGRLRMSEPFRTFLAAEPATAARVLFTASGGVHGRVVAAQHQIFLEAGAEGTCADLAFLYVRVVESALYAELLTGHAVDPVLAERAARSVLSS